MVLPFLMTSGSCFLSLLWSVFSDNKIAIYNVTNSSWTGDLSYQFFSAYGYYDAAVQFQLKPLLVGKYYAYLTPVENYRVAVGREAPYCRR